MGIFDFLFKKKKQQTPKELPQEKKEMKKEEPKKEIVEEVIYHVKAHPESGWQVIKSDGVKALKRFTTQALAIEYAKELVANDELKHYIVFKKDGTKK